MWVFEAWCSDEAQSRGKSGGSGGRGRGYLNGDSCGYGGGCGGRREGGVYEGEGFGGGGGGYRSGSCV